MFSCKLALLGFFYLCFFSVLSSLFVLQMWISIDYASKLDKPFFLYAGLISRSYFDNNFPLFRQLDFGSPGTLSLINFMWHIFSIFIKYNTFMIYIVLCFAQELVLNRMFYCPRHLLLSGWIIRIQTRDRKDIFRLWMIFWKVLWDEKLCIIHSLSTYM